MNSRIVEQTKASIKNIDRLTDIAAIDIFDTTHQTLDKYDIMKEHSTNEYFEGNFYQESVLAGILIGAGVIGVAVSAFFIIKKIIDTQAKGNSSKDGSAASVDLTSEKSIEQKKAELIKAIGTIKNQDQMVKLPCVIDADYVKGLKDVFNSAIESLQSITDSSTPEEIKTAVNGLNFQQIENADPSKIVINNPQNAECKASDIIGQSNYDLLVEFVKLYKDVYAAAEKGEANVKKAKAKGDAAEVASEEAKADETLRKYIKILEDRFAKLPATERAFIESMNDFVKSIAAEEVIKDNAAENPAQPTSGSADDGSSPQVQQQQQQQGADAQNSDQDANDKPEVLHYHPDKPDPGRIPDTAEAKANKKTLDDTVNMLKSGKSEEDVRNALALNNYNNDQINAFLNEAKEIAGRKDKIIKALMAKGKSQTVATAIATDVCDKYNGDLAQYMNAKIAENQGNAWADNEAYKNCMIIADVIGFDKASITKPSQGTPEQQNGPENANPEGSSQDNNGGEVYTKYEDIPEEKLKAIAAKIYPRSKYEDAKDRIKPYIRAALAGEDNIKDALDRNAGWFYHKTIAATNPMPMENALKGMTDMFNSYKGAAEELGKPFPFDLNFYLGQVDPSLRKQQKQVQNPPTNPPTPPTNPPTPPTSEPEKKSEPQSENSGGPIKITYSSDNKIIINGEDTEVHRVWPDEPDENEKGEKVINYFISTGDDPDLAASEACSIYIYTDFELDGIKQYYAEHNDEDGYKECVDLCNVLGFDASQLSPSTPGSGENSQESPEQENANKETATSENSSKESKQSENTDDRQLIDELKAKIKQNPEYLDRFKKKNPDDAIPDNIDWWMQYVMDGPYEDDQYNHCLAIAYNELLKENPTENPPTPTSFEDYRDAQQNPTPTPESQPAQPVSIDEDTKNKIIDIGEISHGISRDTLDQIVQIVIDDINNNRLFDPQKDAKPIIDKLAQENGQDPGFYADGVLSTFARVANSVTPQNDAARKYVEDVKSINPGSPNLEKYEEAPQKQITPENFTKEIITEINQIPSSMVNNAKKLANSPYDDKTKLDIANNITAGLRSMGKGTLANDFASILNNDYHIAAAIDNTAKDVPNQDTGAVNNNIPTSNNSVDVLSANNPNNINTAYNNNANADKVATAINTDIQRQLESLKLPDNDGKYQKGNLVAIAAATKLIPTGESIINKIDTDIDMASSRGETDEHTICSIVSTALSNAYSLIHTNIIKYKRKFIDTTVMGTQSDYGRAVTTLCEQIREICIEYICEKYNVNKATANLEIPSLAEIAKNKRADIYKWYREFQIEMLRDKKLQMLMEMNQDNKSE